MACHRYGGAVICVPGGFVRRRILHCATCQCRRRMTVIEYVWYQPIVTCCACGDSWEDGQRRERPFRPGWRLERVLEARSLWDAAPSYDAAAREAWLKNQLGMEDSGG